MEANGHYDPMRSRLIAAVRELRMRQLSLASVSAGEGDGDPEIGPQPSQPTPTQPSPSLPYVPQPPLPETPHVPEQEPEPKRYPIHPDIPAEPIHGPEIEVPGRRPS